VRRFAAHFVDTIRLQVLDYDETKDAIKYAWQGNLEWDQKDAVDADIFTVGSIICSILQLDIVLLECKYSPDPENVFADGNFSLHQTSIVFKRKKWIEDEAAGKAVAWGKSGWSPFQILDYVDYVADIPVDAQSVLGYIQDKTIMTILNFRFKEGERKHFEPLEALDESVSFQACRDVHKQPLQEKIATMKISVAQNILRLNPTEATTNCNHTPLSSPHISSVPSPHTHRLSLLTARCSLPSLTLTACR